ncbi:glycosyltransferase [Alkalicoccus chagannorensis]
MSLLWEMDRSRADITVLLMKKEGAFLKQLPPDVRVMALEAPDELTSMLDQPPRETSVRLWREGRRREAVRFVRGWMQSRSGRTNAPLLSQMASGIPQQKETYDIAVAFAGPFDFISYYVAERISAERKVQWIHFDITRIGFHAPAMLPVYRKFDHVFAVSSRAASLFRAAMPELADRTETVYNVLSPARLMLEAQMAARPPFDPSLLHVVSVGRLCWEKGQDELLRAAALVREEAAGWHLHLIGDGPMRPKLEALADRLDLSGAVTFHGTIENPYAFIQACDLYVQPSRHEGYCLTLAEARCFNRPIVTTNFTGAEEQIAHQQTGIVTEEDAPSLAAGMLELLQDPEKRHAFSSALEQEEPDTSTEALKLLRIPPRAKEESL